jgi:hypothetical protein
MKIGNSLLSDTINCFDQLNESSKVRIKKSVILNKIPKKVRIGIKNKTKFLNSFLPPLIAIFSLTLFSAGFIFFYDFVEDKKSELINLK